ncbi:hypothetical protein AAE478_008649 [Parahypoxylon ruwenzoriense]
MRSFKFTVALTSLLGLASSSQGHQPGTRDLEPPQPWKVTKMSSFSPSGRPGSSTTAWIQATISSPGSVPAGPQEGGNATATFDASTANCTAEWEFAEEQPFGRTYDCVTVSPVSSSGSVSTWSLEIQEGGGDWVSPTGNFNATFTLKTNLTTPDGDSYYKVLVGTQHFAVGDNMRGSCGGSGVCSWYLMEESNPVLIQPTLVVCEGTC